MTIVWDRIEKLLNKIIHAQNCFLKPCWSIPPTYEYKIDWDATQNYSKTDANNLKMELQALKTVLNTYFRLLENWHNNEKTADEKE